MLANLLTSILRVSSCTFGIGNGLAWYGPLHVLSFITIILGREDMYSHS